MRKFRWLFVLLLFGFIFSTAYAKVNINTASKSELESLPRIGPATAQKIIDYREEYGGFAKIEDIMNIKGIGQGTFEKLKDLITVGDVSGLKIKPYRGSKKYAGKGGASTTTRRRTSRYSYSGKLNINTATAEELDKLPGIGPTTAARIVEYRDMHKFKMISDIKKVKGIGDKLYEKIKPYIKVEGPSNFKAVKKRGTTSKATKSKSRSAIQGKININTASASELTALPGIGPAKAERIVEYRKMHGDFKSPHDIVKVKGIGEKTYEKLKDYITTE